MRLISKRLVELIENSRFGEMSDFVQHGDTSCLLHTAAVAYYSVRLADRLGIKCSRGDLVRGALLHDYFLYDWHDGDKKRRIHGFTHPGAALKNADDDFELTRVERDIIKKHMFPLTVIPPLYRESWIVCGVDKACSLYETFTRGSYPALRNYLKNSNIHI